MSPNTTTNDPFPTEPRDPKRRGISYIRWIEELENRIRVLEAQLATPASENVPPEQPLYRPDDPNSPTKADIVLHERATKYLGRLFRDIGILNDQDELATDCDGKVCQPDTYTAFGHANQVTLESLTPERQAVVKEKRSLRQVITHDETRIALGELMSRLERYYASGNQAVAKVLWFADGYGNVQDTPLGEGLRQMRSDLLAVFAPSSIGNEDASDARPDDETEADAA